MGISQSTPFYVQHEQREVLVCEVSGVEPERGSCPLHNGDRCLIFVGPHHVESKRVLFREAVEGLHRALLPKNTTHLVAAFVES